MKKDALGRASRFDNTVIGGNFKITQIDLDVLQLLQHYDYLPSKWIGALLGMEGHYYQDVLKKLRKQAGLIYWPASGMFTNALYQQAVYALTIKGRAYLKERGVSHPRPKGKKRELVHDLGAALFEASLVIGAKQHGIELITEADMLAHPNCPPATHKKEDPFLMHTTFDYTPPKHGRTVTLEKRVKSDGHFIGFATKLAGGKRRSLIFPGFEIDRGTEPHEPEDYDRAFVAEKFLAFRQLLSEGAYVKQFGFPAGNHISPIISFSETEQHNLMALLARLTNNRGSKAFIFQVLPDFAHLETIPDPSGYYLTAPYKRVGHPDFCLLEELGLPLSPVSQSA